MKTPLIHLFRFCFALLIPFLLLTPAKGEFDPDHLSTFTERGMDLWNVPGMAVAVVNRDEALFQKGFGSTAIDGGRPVDEHTLFAIASTTKAMVVAGILMLVDEDKLSLDDLVIKHIPELHFSDPLLTQQVMVRDLLAHRTGLPSTDLWAFFQNMPLDEQIRRLQTVEPSAPIRTRLIYQNTMFEIAGLIIERLSGQRWDRFLTQRLWQPIGMLETYGAREQIPTVQSHVTPYYFINDQLEVAKWDWPAELADAAGSVWSSIHDMSLWAQFLLRGGVTDNKQRLISEQGFEQMFVPHQLASPGDFYPTVELTQPNWRSYGLGWFQQDFQGRMINFHTGSLGGLIAIIGLDRGDNQAVIVLGNRDHAEMRHALLWEVMDKSDGDTRRDWNQDIFELYEKAAKERENKWQKTRQKRLTNTRPSLDRVAYTGTYRSAKNGDIIIASSGHKLLLKATLLEREIKHWHLDTFLMEYEPWQLHEFVTFQIAPDGSVISLKVFADNFKHVKVGSEEILGSE